MRGPDLDNVVGVAERCGRGHSEASAMATTIVRMRAGVIPVSIANMTKVEVTLKACWEIYACNRGHRDEARI